ncbi:MAG TPA: NAD(P)H-hydrate dehydratase [Candidatus Dormibacteraeota bacterium]|nr:NAD(P)H-hydrate dehydratase [Candidatus Dormibacteraeota bacterium]
MPPETLRQLLKRSPETHKYDYGHVLVVGGSPGMVGAPLLAAEAALRAGAGLVTIASHATAADKLEKRVREVMTLRLPADLSAAVDELAAFIKRRKVSVVVIGPGQTPDFAALSPALLSKIRIPVVIDGGALGAFQGKLENLKKAAHPLILTPHAGEFQKLTGAKPPTGREQLRRVTAQFASEYQVTLVFKGHHTLVAHPDGQVYENTTGNPGVATAGTGDVLSGIIAALLAQVPDTAQAVEAAVYLHGLAGDLAAKAKTEPGMIASDVIEQIPMALAEKQ